MEYIMSVGKMQQLMRNIIRPDRIAKTIAENIEIQKRLGLTQAPLASENVENNHHYNGSGVKRRVYSYHE